MTAHNVLTQLKVRSLDRGKYADGKGLWLVKSRKEAGRWMLRIVVNGKRREMGLGPWPDVGISEARERASAARRRLRDGIDPIEERRKHQAPSKKTTLAEVVGLCFEARKAELKDDGKAGGWMSPLNIHVLPKIGNTPVDEVNQHILKEVMEPIWHTKSDTARKAINRVNLSLKHGAALGLDVDLQAVMKAKALLGKRRHEVKHIPSLPYPELPKFYKWLCSKPITSTFALRFLILTVARTSEVRFASFQEIVDDIWTLPANRTKSGRAHRIPLSHEASNIVSQMKANGSPLLFPTERGKEMSDATMSAFMKREGYDARPHGFRATFRTWVEEQTDTPFEVKETALAHNVDTGVVGAYQRSDRLKKRANLMQAWAEFVLS